MRIRWGAPLTIQLLRRFDFAGRTIRRNNYPPDGFVTRNGPQKQDGSRAAAVHSKLKAYDRPLGHVRKVAIAHHIRLHIDGAISNKAERRIAFGPAFLQAICIDVEIVTIKI